MEFHVLSVLKLMICMWQEVKVAALGKKSI